MKILSSFFKSSIMSSLALVLLGLLLIFQSEITIISISYIIGAVLIIIGVLALLKLFKNTSEGVKSELDIVYGVVCIILGVVVISNPQAIASIIPLVIGTIIIINSATKLQYSLELKKNNNDLWKTTMIVSGITALCGIILIFNPFKGAVFITKIIGGLILIYAILDIISTIAIKNTVKQIHEAIEETIVDAEIIEEKESSKEKIKKKKSNKKKTIKKKGEE